MADYCWLIIYIHSVNILIPSHSSSYRSVFLYSFYFYVVLFACLPNILVPLSISSHAFVILLFTSSLILVLSLLSHCLFLHQFGITLPLIYVFSAFCPALDLLCQIVRFKHPAVLVVSSSRASFSNPPQTVRSALRYCTCLSFPLPDQVASYLEFISLCVQLIRYGDIVIHFDFFYRYYKVQILNRFSKSI